MNPLFFGFLSADTINPKGSVFAAQIPDGLILTQQGIGVQLDRLATLRLLSFLQRSPNVPETTEWTLSFETNPGFRLQASNTAWAGLTVRRGTLILHLEAEEVRALQVLLEQIPDLPESP